MCLHAPPFVFGSSKPAITILLLLLTQPFCFRLSSNLHFKALLLSVSTCRPEFITPPPTRSPFRIPRLRLCTITITLKKEMKLLPRFVFGAVAPHAPPCPWGAIPAVAWPSPSLFLPPKNRFPTPISRSGFYYPSDSNTIVCRGARHAFLGCRRSPITFTCDSNGAEWRWLVLCALYFVL